MIQHYFIAEKRRKEAHAEDRCSCAACLSLRIRYSYMRPILTGCHGLNVKVMWHKSATPIKLANGISLVT